ncbi:MAG: glycosylhydrolase-like jelly roll fold domain-containing protein [Terrimicrobiaceae bacterium]
MESPVTGTREFATAYRETSEGVSLPLDLPPFGSLFVIFRQPASAHPARGAENSPRFAALRELDGAWTVSFDPRWGGPGEVKFPTLSDWTESSVPGIKYYSGTAVYRREFESPSSWQGKSLWLDLGKMRELAEIKVNGISCGIIWAPPFRVNIGHAVQPGTNKLEIEVVNFWPNRLIGDAGLPKEQRLTRTNVQAFDYASKAVPNSNLDPDKKKLLLPYVTPMPSGLFGPVQIVGQIPVATR